MHSVCRALEMVAESDRLLVVGSSLMVSRKSKAYWLRGALWHGCVLCVEAAAWWRCSPVLLDSDARLFVKVYSAFRLARAAKEANAQVAAVCVGPTRGDDFLDLKVQ